VPDIRRSVSQLIDDRTGEMLSLLERLVNMDSGTYDKELVERVAGVLTDELAAAGFSVERYEAGKYARHIVASRKGSRHGSKRILLVGHMDTVFLAGESSRRPYAVSGGKAFGPGVHDMKCGLVAAIYACRALLECGFAGLGDITILMNTDEEAGSPTSRGLIEDAAKQADAAFVLECAYPDGSVVTARKGVGMYHLYIEGVAAHAGANPENGVSATHEMAEKILAIHALTDFSLGTTLNVGVVKAGTRSNVVADHAEAEIDLRVVTQAEAERVARALAAIAKPSLRGASVRLEGGLNRPPMERTDAVARLFALVRAEGDKLGMRVLERSTGGASDGNFVGAVGTPIVDGMGPQGGFAHSLDEFMDWVAFPSWVKLLAYSIIAVNEQE
jgi:glutamate carboxypeptidase